jgi:hypothetical protein
MVIIGWEKPDTAYTTTETDGNVTMCAVVTSGLPLGRTVVVTAETQDISAVAGVDYDAINTVLTFVPGGATRQCVTVPINQDEICEDDPNETFSGVLSNTNSDPLLTIAPTTATVTILDDNEPECRMVIIGWENTAYTTTETDGNVTMCAVITSGLPLGRTVVVTADTQDITAIAGVDYDAINTVLKYVKMIQMRLSVVSYPIQTFVPGGATRQCITVAINQDEMCEDDPNETFRGVLSNTNSDPLLTIAPNTATVTILDDNEPDHCNCYNT